VNGGEMSGEKGGACSAGFQKSLTVRHMHFTEGAVEKEERVSISLRQVGGKGRQGTGRGSHKRDDIVPRDRQVSGALCVLIVVIQTQWLCV